MKSKLKRGRSGSGPRGDRVRDPGRNDASPSSDATHQQTSPKPHAYLHIPIQAIKRRLYRWWWHPGVENGWKCCNVEVGPCSLVGVRNVVYRAISRKDGTFVVFQ